MTQPSSSPPAPAPPVGLLYGAWVVALLATLGSLFFSEVLKHPPCTLCWYQRIFLYPLVLLLPVGILLGDRRVVHYTLPLVVVGLGFALYHNLLYYGVIPEALVPCTGGVSCSQRQISWLGFIGIPLLALGAFVSILALLLAHTKLTARGNPTP
jgi:disulfide bond formation protein DsbB